MLRRAENVRLGFSPSIFTGKGRVTVWVGKKDYTLSQKWHKDEWAKARTAQQRFPVLVLATADRYLWEFCDRFYWDNDELTADQVYALLVTGSSESSSASTALRPWSLWAACRNPQYVE